MKQLIISIGRESGSGGHEIAEKLAQRFDLPLYDNNLLSEIAKDRNLNEEELRRYEEAPRNRFFSRSIRGVSNSVEATVTALQTARLRTKSSKGESFVIVGRCAESVLADNPGLISIFISGDPDTRIHRLMARHDLSAREAADYMNKQDRRRRAYHDENCSGRWGDSANYHLTINSSLLGIDGTVSLLEHYIRERASL